jgi:hypothetical protein
VTAATEAAHPLPASTSRLTIKAREGLLRIAWSAGETATKYLTVPPGGVYEQDRLDKTVSFTVYLYCSQTSVVEIETWQ